MATPYQNQNDEIDLLELFAKFVLIIRRNTLMILVAFVVGTLLGLCYYQFVPKTYESKLVVTSEILTESYSKTLFENINQLIDEGNFATLSSKLNISTEEASKIGRFSVKNVVEKPDGLKEEDKSYLTIRASSNDNTIWLNLQKGIMYYLQNNEFVKIRVEQKRRYFTEMILKIDEELTYLETLKLSIANGEVTKGKKENLLLIDPSSINKNIIELNKEKFKFKNDLEIVNSVQIIEGFTIYDKPSNPKLSISLVAGASFGLFFVVIIIAFKGIRSMLRFSEERLGKV